MIGSCSKCGNLISRYWVNTWKDPCEVCGGVLFFILHLGFLGRPTHYILRNVETQETLSDDMCDYYKERDLINVK